MLIVFEARMLIVLNCVRGLYYAGCFFPGKILNIFFLVYLRKFDYVVWCVLSSALLRKNPITFALRNVICIHCSYVLITRWCCIPTTHVVEWMCASCSLLIKCVGKRGWLDFEFDRTMLIVLKCVREFYYEMCYFFSFLFCEFVEWGKMIAIISYWEAAVRNEYIHITMHTSMVSHERHWKIVWFFNFNDKIFIHLCFEIIFISFYFLKPVNVFLFISRPVC